MACEDKTQAFNDTLARIQSEFKKEMDDFAEETKQKTSELDDQLKDGNDIGEGIGAAAGASIGGVIGGAPGAIVGGTIGKAVGSLFEVEITEQRVSFDIIVPEFGIEDQEWIVTMPQIPCMMRILSSTCPP